MIQQKVSRLAPPPKVIRSPSLSDEEAWRVGKNDGGRVLHGKRLRNENGLSIKGQLGVPLTVYKGYLLCSLGILGDYNP